MCLPYSYAIWWAPGALHDTSTHPYVLVHAAKWSHSTSCSHIYFLSHTHTHTLSQTPTCSLLCFCPLVSFMVSSPACHLTLTLRLFMSWSTTICSWLLRPSWGTRLMEVTCLRPGTQPRLPPARRRWWEGQVLPEVSHAFELPCREEVLGGTSRVKICLSLAKDLPFSSAGCRKHLCWIQHNKSSPFSQLTWGILQVTRLFFPSDFGNSQDVKK